MTKGSYLRSSPSQTSERLEKLKFLQALSLDRKIDVSLSIIKKSLEIGRAALLFSGGKDSSILLDLLMRFVAKDKFIVIFNDTTLGNGNLNNYIRLKTAGLTYFETKAENPIEMWRDKGYYPILSKRGFTAYKKKYPDLRVSPVQCCYQLKEKYANPILIDNDIKIVFWGNRASDSNRRKLSFCDNGYIFKPKKYRWYQSYPLQHFNTSDVFDYIDKYIEGYPFSKGYENGCLCCGTDITRNPNNLINLFKKDYSKWVYYMENGFAQQILIAKNMANLVSDIDNIIKTNPAVLLKI